MSLSGVSLPELLAELIRIPSVNPRLDPEGTGEAAIARFCAGWLTERGVPAGLEEVAPGRPNVVAWIGPETGRSLALCAHLDTVSAKGMSIPPFEPRIDSARIFGRGSYDMKCGVAAVMAAGVTLAERDLPGRVVLSLVADEEYASIGAQHFVERHPTDGCILTEPSEGDLILAHKGFLWARVTCRGRAAHGSRWDLGDSANARIARVVTHLDEMDRTRLREREHALVGPASLHCGLLEGGSGLSTYAASATARFERRTLPGEDHEEVFDELGRWVGAADPEAEIEKMLERFPMSTAPDGALASAAREAIRELRGKPARETGVAYWMDAAIFAAAGVETVNYGPSGAGAHEAEEWADLASVEDCAEVLVRSAQRYLS